MIFPFDPNIFDPLIFDTGGIQYQDDDTPPDIRVIFGGPAFAYARTSQRGKPGYQRPGTLSGKYE